MSHAAVSLADRRPAHLERLFDRVRLEESKSDPESPKSASPRLLCPRIRMRSEISSEPVVFAVVGVFPVNGNC